MRQRFIQSFSTSGTEQTAIDNKELGKPYVAYIQDGRYIDWNTKGINYAGVPLTFEIISGGTILWLTESVISELNHYNVEIEYTLDDGQTWTPVLSKYTDPDVINVEAGDTIMFRGQGPVGTNGYANSFGGTAKFKAYGNVNSLLSNDFTEITDLTNYGGLALASIFSACTGIIDASKMVLPATTLTQSCYANMFRKATSLTVGPILPAPVLELSCYRSMFDGCTSLSRIECLATNLREPGAATTASWVSGVSSTGTFVKHPNATWPTGVNGIPEGWTVIDADI